jgi:hypothetical protein
MSNPKSGAWDLIGSDYWAASYNGGPVGADVAAFLEGVDASTAVAVVGASTVHLIRAALGRGASVTVLDFAEGQRVALQKASEQWPGGERCVVEPYDATEPTPAPLRRRFDLVLADRLVNRFTDAEALAGVPGLLSLAVPGGKLRTTIRLGLYERDRLLLTAAEAEGRAGEFFDADLMEIDYGKAGDLLDRAMPKHGDIPRETLLDFYRLRGPEKRMTEADVARYVQAAGAWSIGARILAVRPLSVTTADTLFEIEVSAVGPTGTSRS